MGSTPGINTNVQFVTDVWPVLPHIKKNYNLDMDELQNWPNGFMNRGISWTLMLEVYSFNVN